MNLKAHLWLSGSRIALASRNWRSPLEVSIRFRHVMTDQRTTLDPEHLDELLLLRSFNKLKGSIAKNCELYCVLLNGVIKS